MPSESRCTRCGRTVDIAELINAGDPVITLCEPCSAWQRAHASDQEDRQDATGLGAMRTRSHPHDPVSRR